MCSSLRRIAPRSRASSRPSPARPPRSPSAPRAKAMSSSILPACRRTWWPAKSSVLACVFIFRLRKSPVTLPSTPSQRDGLKRRLRLSRASRFRLSPCFLRPLWWEKSSSRWMSPPPCRRGAPHRPRTSASLSLRAVSRMSSSAQRKAPAAATRANWTSRSSATSRPPMAASPPRSLPMRRSPMPSWSAPRSASRLVAG